MKMNMKQICRELKKTAKKSEKQHLPATSKAKPACGHFSARISAVPDLRSVFYKVNRDRGDNRALIAGAVKLYG